MITQAIVLAAGLGTRLKPLTDTCPKPLLKVRGKPLIIHNLEALQRAGIKNIVTHVSYLADLIISQIGDGKAWGLDLNIVYAKCAQPLESGGGLLLSMPYLPEPTDAFISVNSDIFTNYNYTWLTQFILDGVNNMGHLVLVNNPAEIPMGNYNIDYSNLELKAKQLGLLSKTANSDGRFDYTYSGIAVYHPNLLKSREIHSIFSIVTDINNNLAKFTASFYNGKWHDIGTVSRYNAINNNI